MLGQMLNNNLIVFKFAQHSLDLQPVEITHYQLVAVHFKCLLKGVVLNALLRSYSLHNYKHPGGLLAGTNWNKNTSAAIFEYF